MNVDRIEVEFNKRIEELKRDRHWDSRERERSRSQIGATKMAMHAMDVFRSVSGHG